MGAAGWPRTVSSTTCGPAGGVYPTTLCGGNSEGVVLATSVGAGYAGALAADASATGGAIPPSAGIPTGGGNDGGWPV